MGNLPISKAEKFYLDLHRVSDQMLKELNKLEENQSKYSKKRKLSEVNKCCVESANKRMKIDISTPIVTSKIFLDNKDQKQFQKLFDTIEKCELIQNLRITHMINQQIAEYATGIIQQCHNKKCMKDILILNEYEAIYAEDAEDHENCTKVGYKHCYESERYFCERCMKDADYYDCDCGKLSFIDDCCRCDCGNYMIPDCSDCCNGPCKNCGRSVCASCESNYPYPDHCVECNKSICGNCAVDEEPCWDSFACSGGPTPSWIVCETCHDATPIKCNNCDAECAIIYKSNTCLKYYSELEGDDSVMVRCEYNGCSVFICFHCKEQHRNGKYVRCSRCDKKHLLCDTHVRCNDFQCEI